MIKKIALLILLVLTISVNTHSGKHEFGISAASKSGIKGVCNGDPVSYIIRQHSNLLTHKQDSVLRTGAKKSNQYSLQGCINCHASKKVEKDSYNEVNASGQFCSTCHEKIAVSLDCFDCHRTTPYEGKTYYKSDHKDVK